MSPRDQISLDVRFRLLNELMRVASSSLDMAETFDELGEKIKELIEYDRLSFGFLRPNDDYLEIYVATGTNIESRVRVPLDSSSIGDAVQSRRPVLLSNYPEDSPYELAQRISDELNRTSKLI